jgi:hypothetical protein
MWAFSDESERSGVMLFAVAVIDPGNVDSARRKAAGSPPGRSAPSSHCQGGAPPTPGVARHGGGAIDGLSVTVLRYRRPAGTDRTAGRHLLVQAGAGLVVGSGVTSWVLDDQDPAQRIRDRASIAHALAGIDRQLHPVYDHRPSRSEPLLWAADAACWAAGAGGDWKERLSSVLEIRTIRP